MTEPGFVITPVPVEHLPTVWGDIQAALAPALETAPGKIGLDDVFLAAVDREYVIWLVLEGDNVVAAFTTRVAVYPKRRALIIDWVGGKKMFRWIDAAMSVIKEQAIKHGCLHVEGYGRLAWGRAIRRHGFVPEYVAYKMELGDG
jgi:hypothetical protein